MCLTHGHLDRLGHNDSESRKSYFSDGSISYCLLADGEPVLAGGIVNMQWNRGEAWMLPTPFFHRHVRVCYKKIKDTIPYMAKIGGFKRVQTTCAVMVSTILFEHLGFVYEATLKCFGPNGETCYMYARFFEGVN